MSSKHVRYDVFTAFPDCGRKNECDTAHMHNAEEIWPWQQWKVQLITIAHTEFHEGA